MTLKKKKKKKKESPLKRADRLATQATKKRAGGVCERCGGQGNQPHHIFSRRYRSTRWYLPNLVWLCYACHIHFAHSFVEAFRDWVIERMGAEDYQALKEKAYSLDKVDIQAEIDKLSD